MAETRGERDASGMIGAGLAVVGLLVALTTLLLTAAGAVGTWTFGVAALGLLAAAVALILAAHSISSRRKFDALPLLVCLAALVTFGVFGYTFVALYDAASQHQSGSADPIISITRPGSADSSGLPLTGQDPQSQRPALLGTDAQTPLADTGRLDAEEQRAGSPSSPFRLGTVVRQSGWQISVAGAELQDEARTVRLSLTRTSTVPGPAYEIAVSVLSADGRRTALASLPETIMAPDETSVIALPIPAGEQIRLKIGSGEPIYFDLTS